jgi:hypothetical protein
MHGARPLQDAVEICIGKTANRKIVRCDGLCEEKQFASVSTFRRRFNSNRVNLMDDGIGIAIFCEKPVEEQSVTSSFDVEFFPPRIHHVRCNNCLAKQSFAHFDERLWKVRRDVR